MRGNNIQSKPKEEVWWVPDEAEVWTLASQCSEELPNGCVNFLVHKTQKVIPLQKNSCFLAQSEDSVPPEDLVHLSEVNPASILTCTRSRFHMKRIYTNIGLVLMVVNPFEFISGMYGKVQMKKYQNAMDRSLAAHVYSVPSRAYFNMCSSGNDQSILISGESGAGKTEAAKHCLAFLTDAANMNNNSTSASQEIADKNAAKSQAAEIAERILSASPILEAFGNAKTLRNPNSSRFGKWMVLNFDSANAIRSAKIISYLLEKSRVVQRDPQERSYHIFYQILRGLSKEKLQLLGIDPKISSYKYLMQGSEREPVDLDDAKMLQKTMEAFYKMGFTEEETTHLFSLVLSILSLGNIEFLPLRDGEGSEVKNGDLVEAIASKFSINATILSYSLCNRTIESGKVRKSLITVQLNPQKAMETRDSLARAAYDRLFSNMIATINDKSKTQNHFEEGSNDRFIGLLDIFGFEIFTENSFEQLCINYCNEMLQNHFNYVIFTAEKMLYSSEDIVCETIEFKDNSDVIKEIEGVFKALDEEGRIPKGSSKTWFEKLKRGAKSTNLSFPTRKKGDVFSVKHYAGNVDYNALLFMDKNVETLNNDLLNAMSASTDPIVVRLFAKKDESNGSAGSGLARADSMGTIAAAATSPLKQSSASSLQRSLSYSFIQQLNSLVAMLRKTESHFIRCVKSNDACVPQKFDANIVHKQLIYSGVFEVVKIQQSGLPCRLSHIEFLNRYKCLAPSKLRWTLFNPADFLKSLINSRGYDLRQSKVGTSLVFFKTYEQKQLETQRDDLRRTSSSRISCFLQMKNFSHAFRSVDKYYKTFQQGNNALDSEIATPAYAGFKSACEAFHKLLRRSCLEHVVHRLEKELRFLDRRVELIKDAKDRLTNRTKAGIVSLDEIKTRSIELEITNHPVIVDCRELLDKYYRAVAFVRIVHDSGNTSDGNSDKGTAAGRRSPGTDKDGKILNNLTAVEIKEGVDLLSTFRGLVDGAEESLDATAKHMAAVDEELVNYRTPMLNYLQACVSRYDDDTGHLTFLNPETGLEIARKLQALVQSLVSQAFYCADTTSIFLDCKDYVTLVFEYVWNGDAVSALRLLDTAAAAVGRQINPIFLSQFADFRAWADVQQSGDKLRRLLSLEFVPGSQIGDEGLVSYEEIELLVNKLSKLTDTLPIALSVVKAGTWIVELRKLFLACDWDSLEDVIIRVDAEATENLVFAEYPQCEQELKNCHWQVIYNGLLGDVISVTSETVFRSVSLESDSWLSIVADIDGDTDMLQEIKRFCADGKAPKLSKLAPLLEKVLHLRSLVYSQEVDFAKRLLDQMEPQFQGLVEEFGLVAPWQAEIDACRLLLKKIELEGNLLDALRTKRTERYVSAHDNYKGDYSSQCNLLDSVAKLRETLEALGSLSPTYDKKLTSYINLARDILLGREKLVIAQDSESLSWKSVFEDFEVRVKSQRASAMALIAETEKDGELDRDEPISPRLGLWEEFGDEFTLILEELYRRAILQGLRGIISQKTVLGEVDINVEAQDAVVRDQFVRFNALMALMKTEEYQLPSNLKAFARFTREVLVLRKLVVDKAWDGSLELVLQQLAVLKGCPHGGAAEIQNFAAEATRVQAELNARACVQRLKDDLANLETNQSYDEASDSCMIDVKLAPLKRSLQLVEQNKGQYSQKLAKLTRTIIDIAETLVRNELNLIDHKQVKNASKELLELKIAADNVEKVFDHVRVHNFLKNITKALVQNSSSAEDLWRAINTIKDAIKNLPSKYIPWLKSAYLFCDVSCALSEQGWERIVEASRRLDEFIASSLTALVEVEKESISKFSNFVDAAKVLELLAAQKTKGFQVALQRKKAQDDEELRKKAQQLSPTEALKAQIRHEDMAKNQYSVGHMRKAGFSDGKLSKLNFDAKVLWAYGFDIALLRKSGYSVQSLLAAGYTVHDLLRAGFTAQAISAGGVSLSSMGLTPKELLQAGISEETLIKSWKLSPAMIREIDSDPKRLIKFGMTLRELVRAGFSVLELRAAGFHAAELYQHGLTDVAQFVSAGYDLKQLVIVFPLSDLRDAGFTFNKLKNFGFTPEEMHCAGFVCELEHEALHALFVDTNGEFWKHRKNWMTSCPKREWFGVAVEADEDGRERVVALELQDNNLRGPVPAELCFLRKLKTLKLGSNELTGEIAPPVLQLFEENQVTIDWFDQDLKKSSISASAAAIGGDLHPSSAASAASAASAGPAGSAPAVSAILKASGGNFSTSKPTSKQSAYEQEERAALLEFFHWMRGVGWKNSENWASDKPLGSWFGVTVGADGCVREIALPSNNVKGVIPQALNDLKCLEVLDLRLNVIHGIIPEFLAECRSLRVLYLHSNKLTGQIPDSIGKLSRLRILDLRNNVLIGPVPKAITRLAGLEFLGLRSNTFADEELAEIKALMPTCRMASA